MTTSRLLSFYIYACAFIVGGVLMGFEMLGSRYLFPYFGGSIGTTVPRIFSWNIAVSVCAANAASSTYCS